MKKNFDRTFHYFRAFAILSVLGTHMWISPAVEGCEAERGVLECLRGVLFHSSTLYFIFISGYLFDYVYKTRAFDLKKFYLSKVRNVLSPYLFLSAVFIVFAAWLASRSEKVPFFVNHGAAMLTPGDIADALLYGKACITYWYIPFILSVYLFAPLLFRVRGRGFAVLVALVSLLPLFVTRDELTDFVRNWCYFSPVFVIGVFFSRCRAACVAFIAEHAVLLGVVAVFSSAILAGAYYEPGFWNIETVHYVQRLSIGGLVILGLERMQRDSAFLDHVAEVSFPLYFLHDPVIRATQPLFFGLGLSVAPTGILATSIFAFVCEFLVALGVIWCIRKAAGRRSRMLIGA